MPQHLCRQHRDPARRRCPVVIRIYRGLVEDTLSQSRQADLWVVESGSRGPFVQSSGIPGDVREAIVRLHMEQEQDSVEAPHYV